MSGESVESVDESLGSQGSNLETIRMRLSLALSSKENFLMSAKSSFEQFDEGQKGKLSMEETKRLLERLSVNLELPPVDNNMLTNIFNKYDENLTGFLTFEEFSRFFWHLLCSIRDKYYPEKSILVTRDQFIRRTSLRKADDIRSIFDFVEKIGEGSFGQVFFVREKCSNLSRVCKMIDKSLSNVSVDQIEAEVAVLKNLDHPNIIRIFEVYEDTDHMYIIMEKCAGGELFERIHEAVDKGFRLNEKYVSHVMRQIMAALAYFHSRKIVHKDLKPENILMQEKFHHSAIKIIDFGLAEIFKTVNEHSSHAAGTVLYMAPEVFMRDITMECDVWSAGVIMYFLLAGTLPFSGKSVKEVKNKVLNSEPDYEHECVHISAEGIDLMKLMFQKDPKKRPKAAAILAHPWFKLAKTNVQPIRMSTRLLQNLKLYMKQNQLKQALVNMMAHQLNVTGSQIRNITHVFKELDQDGNGILTPEELIDGLQSVGIPQWDINRIVQAMDADDTGSISYTEFLAACYEWRDTELGVIRAAFNKMDIDGDGKLTVDEFEKVLCSGKQKLLNHRDWDQIIKSADTNRDGVIDWNEFLEYMLK
ncbi:protein kinase domain-containing protein [Cryptosporidium muris RN66]|uniref:non-specific serine/threonine protein kinase n=1 Tax=Cryptosporidium muris (strain RN66) TaxID=441375 RepID=B6AD87_CRYMR|nr:protein kinase domain-containing protein [Cryptosporidium muris RN66]EEA06091.1 protein kinase domain-containing protein [Cryptosporidium muris RN66]|eukprot:XP_002140440.1 protein kinase domain-containing protein [Cryptosporidium muris RN66]